MSIASNALLMFENSPERRANSIKKFRNKIEKKLRQEQGLEELGGININFTERGSPKRPKHIFKIPQKERIYGKKKHQFDELERMRETYRELISKKNYKDEKTIERGGLMTTKIITDTKLRQIQKERKQISKE